MSAAASVVPLNRMDRPAPIVPTAFGPALLARFAELRALYPAEMNPSLVLPLLHAVQDANGHVTEADALGIAAWLGVPRAQVVEALTWYSMFERQPTGQHVIKVCRNISCALRGADDLIAHLQRRLGIGPGETTADGRFTLQAVECLAACGTAPAMQVDRTYHERLTTDAIDRILEALR